MSHGERQVGWRDGPHLQRLYSCAEGGSLREGKMMSEGVLTLGKRDLGEEGLLASRG